MLAGLLYMAISVPLIVLTVDQEDANAQAQAQAAASTIEQWVSNGTTVTRQQVDKLRIGWVHVTILGTGSALLELGPDDVVGLADIDCDGEARVIEHGGASWAVACVLTPTHRIAAGVVPQHTLASQILYWTLILAVLVGIVTAWGQAQLLRPLTRMAQALERVGRGERSVHVASTGLREFDEVVDRINEAAGHVEGRVDAITARVTVVQEMARMVAHEVRNPLQSLELLTSLIAREADEAEREEIARSIHDEIRGLDQVVHRLLREGATTGALRLRRRPQSVAALADQVARLHQPAAQRRGIRLSVGLVSHEEAPVDGAMLGRSIENLVINAMQAVSDGTGEIRLSVFVDKSKVHITVDDNGPGADPSIRASMFEPDVTGRATGNGLGLALVRAVIMAHDGTIEYSTSPMGGARFQASLPLGQGNEEP